MLTADFDFDLPDELIAQFPVEPRDHSRLLVINRQTSRLEHRWFRELPTILNPLDILALNNTRVMPARLTGFRHLTGGKWEGLFLRDLENGSWEVLSKTRGRLAKGEVIVVGPGLQLRLVAEVRPGCWIVQPAVEMATVNNQTTLALLEEHGHTPIPPYIRKGKEDALDQARYQTIFAEQPGSIAAPTAGLHFSATTFQELSKRAIAWTSLTLHVGIGTFQPIKTRLIADHSMHAEWAQLSPLSVSQLNARRNEGGRIVAVGSTATRTLEAAALTGKLMPFTGQTDLFIQPGHIFRGVDALITNFHLPRSTLLVLVTAFAGKQLIHDAYQEAIQHRYRFYSYGDAMLIL